MGLLSADSSSVHSIFFFSQKKYIRYVNHLPLLMVTLKAQCSGSLKEIGLDPESAMRYFYMKKERYEFRYVSEHDKWIGVFHWRLSTYCR